MMGVVVKRNYENCRDASHFQKYVSCGNDCVVKEMLENE